MKNTYYKIILTCLFIFLIRGNLPAEKTETLKGVYISQKTGNQKTSSRTGETFYTAAGAVTAGNYSFVDLQVLEPVDKLTTYKNNVYFKGLVSQNISSLSVAGNPIKIMDKGVFFTSVDLNTFGKHLIEVVGRTKSQELVIKKRILYLASFSDVRSGQWASDAIEYLATLGYLMGLADNRFNPEGSVTRAEMAVILTRLKKAPSEKLTDLKLGDVSANYWAAQEIKNVLAFGWMEIFSKYYFYPARPLSRAELFTTICRLEGFSEVKNLRTGPFSDVPASHRAAGSIEALKRAGWFNELAATTQAKFYPDIPVTRRELAFWLSKISFVAGEIKNLLDWDKGFSGIKEVLPVAEPVLTPPAAVGSEPAKPLKLTEVRSRPGPPAAEAVVTEEQTEKTQGGKEIYEPAVTTIAPSRQALPGVRDKTVSFDFKDVDIADVLKIFSQEMGMNVIAGDDVTGKINVTFNKVPVQEAFETVLKRGNLSYLVEGDIILVYPISGVGNLLGRQTIVHIYHISYADLNEVQEKVNKVISKFGETIIDKRLRLLIARDLPESLEQIDQIVKALDAPPKQVLVQAMILDINLTTGKSFGTKWLSDQLLTPGMKEEDYLKLPQHEWMGTGYPSTGNTPYAGEKPMPVPTDQGFYIHVLKSGFRGFLNAVQSVTDYDILASPSIIALNHEKAKIFAGESKAYQSMKSTTVTQTGTTETETINFFDTGISLEFTPHITDNGFIVMEIIPEISAGEIIENKYPSKTSTKTETSVMVKDGQTIMLGGLVRDRSDTKESGIPILSQIPFIGVFFRSKQIIKTKRELVIMLTPYIIDDKMLKKFAEDKAELDSKRIEKKRSFDIFH